MGLVVFMFLITGIGDAAANKYIEDLFRYYSQVMNNPQCQEARELINQNKYEDAFKLLAENAIKNPELEVPFISAMIVLRQQINSKTEDTDKNSSEEDFLNKYYTVADSILDTVSPESRKFLLSDLAEICVIQNQPQKAYSYMDEMIKDIGTIESDDYALAMYQYANTAMLTGENLKAMQILEDLRRNRNYYSEGIQDKVNFQLFNIYGMLGKTDFVIKLGEELRNKFEKKEIKDFSDVSDLLNVLKNLADVYLERKLYAEANELYDKIIELLKKYKTPDGDIRKKYFSQLLIDTESRKKMAMTGMGLKSDTHIMTGEELSQELKNKDPKLAELFKKNMEIIDSTSKEPEQNTNTLSPETTNNKTEKSNFFLGFIVAITITIIFFGGTIPIVLRNKRKK